MEISYNLIAVFVGKFSC
nr:unnamed protein product [Callosobruchus chinensis]